MHRKLSGDLYGFVAFVVVVVVSLITFEKFLPFFAIPSSSQEGNDFVRGRFVICHYILNLSSQRKFDFVGALLD